MSFQNVESQTDYLMQHRSCISRHQVLTLQVGNKGARHDEEERRGGRHDCGGGQAGAECRGSEIWTSRLVRSTVLSSTQLNEKLATTYHQTRKAWSMQTSLKRHER